MKIGTSAASNHNFSRVPAAEIPRSRFDRSCGYKTTFDGGFLVPVFLDEALPGDTFNVDMTAFARLATPLVPFMDNLYLDSFFLLFLIALSGITGKNLMVSKNPGDSTSFWFLF